MSRRKPDNPNDAPTLHRFEAKHYVVATIIILLAVGMFAYSWS